MKYLDLKEKIADNIFTYLDVLKIFSRKNSQTIKTQLFRFLKKGLITKIKRGLYCFEPDLIDEFDLAERLYQPSYISLETALNYYGLIPDVPQAVTSINLTTTKKIKNRFGDFFYNKIKPPLFFGFLKIKSPKSAVFFNLARKEKALLDYFYIRKIKKIDDLRLNLKELDLNLYQEYGKNFPDWVQKIKL